MKQDLLSRFQKWAAIAVALCFLLYLGGTIWAGYEKIQNQLSNFAWWTFGVALVLTLVNYILRFVKWHYLTLRLGVKIDWRSNAWNFFAGLSMVISPGKAGELLKPYVLRKLTGTPMATTIPALITERLTDGIAMLILAAVGLLALSTEQDASAHMNKIVFVATIIVCGLAVLANQKLSIGIINLLAKLPAIGKISEKLLEMYQAMRTCVAPVSLIWTVFLSVIAWGAECIAYQLIWYGFSIPADIGSCLFLYAFATVVGIPMPGGIGATDGVLTVLPTTFITGLPPDPTAVILTVMMLTRIATMWFGVGLGAFALLRVSNMLGGTIQIQGENEEST